MELDLKKVAEDSARGGFFLVSGTIIATVISAIASILIGRLLGPELYGFYTLALVIPQLFFLITDLGINHAIVKFVAIARAKGEVKHISGMIKYGILTRLVIGVLIFLIVFIFSEALADLFFNRPELSYYLRIASLSMVFQIIFSASNSAFMGLDKPEFSALATEVQAIVKSIVSIVLVIIGLNVIGVIIGYVVGMLASAIVAIISLFYVLRKIGGIDNSDISFKPVLKKMITYGAPLFASTLFIGFVGPYQNVILASFVSNVEIGNFKATSNFIMLLTAVTAQITSALLPAFSKFDSKSEHQAKTLFSFTNKYTTILIIPLTTLLVFFSTEIVQITYGSTYQNAGYFLSLYGLLYFLVGIGYLNLPSLFNGLNQTKKTFNMNLITFLIILFLSPLATYFYSIQGLIVSLILANIVGVVYGMWVAKKQFHIHIDKKNIIKIYLIAVLSIVPLIPLRQTMFSSIPTIIIGGLVYFLVYVTLMPLTNIVNAAELDTMIPILNKIKFLGTGIIPILRYQKRIIKIKKTRSFEA